ncbi:hypothetical protein K490DRAFT_76324 [Saccharata proteae CBS 121410]|uniref:Nuclear segregation protein n=1 Tax=Saccharata proteae CBS 121410 TaxID=1314787 RepID=A0A9P4HNF0_9PEZI|nr:hypothetical protein K490DRAFT_76324 [Saccharata proteae CBS 121410]
MADLATPSAVAMSTSEPQAAPKANKGNLKPERPDEDEYRKNLAQAEKEHAAAQEKLKALKAKIDLATPNNKDSPTAQKQQALRAELAQIRTKQQAGKGSRNQTMEKIKKLDEQLKSRINEQKTARSRVNFKSTDDVDREIERLQKQVDSGSMKIVDEKKALAEISALHKQKKSFAGFDQAQKGIDDVKAQISELRKTMDDPESKALSERYTAITKELDAIKAEQDEAYKSLNSLRDQRTKAHAEQQEKWAALKETKDKYFEARRAYKNYEQEAYKVRKERQDAERKAWEAGKRRQVADQKLEEASAPAYQDEILTAEGLIRYFDPSALPAKESAGPSAFAAQPQRTVDTSGLKGVKLARKDELEESYFVGTGGKKGKKGRKGNNASPASTPAPEGKFNLSIGIIEQLAKVNVEAPSGQADVPAVVEKLKAKLDEWKKDQDRKTKENIAKAQKEIERLESESSANVNGTSEDKATKPSAKNQQVNGSADASAELAQEKDAAADVTEDMKKASVEDKEDAKAEAEA